MSGKGNGTEIRSIWDNFRKCKHQDSKLQKRNLLLHFEGMVTQRMVNREFIYTVSIVTVVYSRTQVSPNDKKQTRSRDYEHIHLKL